MAGRVDWATFITKVYEAFDKKVNSLLYQAVMDGTSKVLPTSQFIKTGTIVKDSLLELIEDVQAANNGADVVIMGTRSALAKLPTDVEWISNDMKNERHTTGRLGIWEGTKLAEIPQAFADNDTTTKLVDNKVLLVMPVTDNKFVKFFNEGEAIIKEVSDGTTNMDMTMEYEYMMKLGFAIVINRKFGKWTMV